MKRRNFRNHISTFRDFIYRHSRTLKTGSKVILVEGAQPLEHTSIDERILSLFTEDAEIHFLGCAGKENVKDFTKLLLDKRKYFPNLKNIGGIVDRDFEPKTVEGDVYYLPCYEIENLLISKIPEHEDFLTVLKKIGCFMAVNRECHKFPGVKYLTKNKTVGELLEIFDNLSEYSVVKDLLIMSLGDDSNLNEVQINATTLLEYIDALDVKNINLRIKGKFIIAAIGYLTHLSDYDVRDEFIRDFHLDKSIYKDDMAEIFKAIECQKLD